ncbi:MAG: tetratricopeptide repeat protein [Flavobacteriales bacterium]|jgi:signal transduction histidine kinase
MKRFWVLAATACCAFHAHAQIDSLQQVLITQTGRERVLTLQELAIQLSAEDPRAGIASGRMALKEARIVGDSVLVANCINDFGYALLVGGNYDTALVALEYGLVLRQTAGDDAGVAKMNAKIAVAAMELGRLDRALTAGLEALAFFEAGNQIPYVLKIKNNLALVYSKLREYDYAEKYYKELVTLATALELNDVMLNSSANLGDLYRRQDRFEESLAQYKIAQDIAIKAGMNDRLPLLQQSTGIVLRKQGKTNEALAMFSEALAAFRERGDETSVAYVLINMANAHIDQGEYETAQTLLDEALVIARRMASYNELKYAYKTLARCAYARNDGTRGDAYFEEFEAYKDSMFTERSNALISEYRVKYDVQQKELELANERVDKISYRNGFIYALGSALLILAAALVWAQRARLRRLAAEQQAKTEMEEERTRIARDLHDHLGAELTLIAAKLDIRAAKADREQERDELQVLGQHARQAGQVMRETIWSIRNTAITTEDLMHKVAEFARKAAQGLSISLEVDPISEQPIILKPQQAIHLFRIVQEAVQNAVKHAACTQIHITTQARSITVRDNGRGISAHQTGAGHGLKNMRDRAAEIGATCEFVALEQGTEVRIHF